MSFDYLQNLSAFCYLCCRRQTEYGEKSEAADVSKETTVVDRTVEKAEKEEKSRSHHKEKRRHSSSEDSSSDSSDSEDSRSRSHKRHGDRSSERKGQGSPKHSSDKGAAEVTSSSSSGGRDRQPKVRNVVFDEIYTHFQTSNTEVSWKAESAV